MPVPTGDVEEKRRTSPQSVLTALVIFVMAVVLLLGDIRLYELRQNNLRLEQEVRRLRQEAAEQDAQSENQEDRLTRAKALGLRETEPDQRVLLYLRE